MTVKVKRNNKADCGDDFIPPDGGWGWIICIASGITNIFLFPVFSYFGLIFREKFEQNGITSQQISIMINSQMGVAALSGFFYGPIFRKFTFRKVAIFGSIQLITGIFFLSQVESFPIFLLIYVFYLAIGKELIITAKQMAFNTYFKEKRRIGLSIVAGLPSLANIIMPAIITFFMYLYSSSGTLLILCALAGNVLVASLTYQPVKWHMKKEIPTIDNIEMMDVQNSNTESQDQEMEQIERDESKKMMSSNDIKNKETILVEDTNDDKLEQSKELIESNKNTQIEEIKNDSSANCCSKIAEFFDMDLVKDLSFINICFGMSCAMLVEQNFKILSPFFLKDFGYTDSHIALAMSIGQIPDLITKILMPHILKLFGVKLTNRTLWIICVFGMMIGEVIIAQNPSYSIIICFMFVEGIFSGAKSIFTGMLIPDHVLLKKMPGAFGINRFISGIFMIGMGPIIGGIRDKSNYTMALLFLNFISLLPIILWIIERCASRSKKTEINEH